MDITMMVNLFKKEAEDIAGSFIPQIKVERKMDFSKIKARTRQLWDLYELTKNNLYLMEDDCIGHLFECEGFETYQKIAQFCEDHDIQRVVDIGCAYGHQSEVFMQYDIDYVGLNDGKCDFWNRDEFDYHVGTYPCKLPIQKGDLGISVLCITWNVYLHDGQETLYQQCKALSEDFEHCLIYVQPSHLGIISEYFKKVEKIDEHNLYYFSNK